MKISKSKKELARIISENGGWREGAEFAAQDSNENIYGARVCFYHNKPYVNGSEWMDGENGLACDADDCIKGLNAIKNWHQATLSREEYFHLYPAPDAKPEFCESVVRSIPDPDEQIWTNPPSIEQLAADYRNLLDFARRKQQEADDAKADADARLKALEIAGEAIGLTVSPITEKQEPELVITDWRDLQVGDVIRCIGDWQGKETHAVELSVDDVESPGYGGNLPIRVILGNGDGAWGKDFKFIRRT